jgi:hypothetical protein
MIKVVPARGTPSEMRSRLPKGGGAIMTVGKKFSYQYHQSLGRQKMGSHDANDINVFILTGAEDVVPRHF